MRRGLTPCADDAPDGDIAAGVALCPDLSPQLPHVVFARVPALAQIRQVGITAAGASMEREFGKGRHSQELGDGLPGDAEASGNLVGRDPLLGQRDDLMEVLLTRRMPFLFAASVRVRPFRRAGNCIGWSTAQRRLMQARMVAGEAAVEHLTGIDEQMKTVGNLFGLGSAQGRAHRIVTA